MKRLQTLKRLARGHVYTIVVSAILAAGVVAWVLAPVADAMAGVLDRLAQALGSRRP